MRRRINRASLASLLMLGAAAAPALADLQVQSVNPPAIVDNLGQMAVIGQYDAISLYTYEGQQNGIASPYFDSIIAQVDNNKFLNQGTSNGLVADWCQINEMVYLTGNFTNIGSVDTQDGFAQLNASTGDISALSHSLNGTIFTLYCNSSDNTIYAGGNFTYENSTGVAVYSVDSGSWSAPAFSGFSRGASVHTIVDFKDNLIFGGSFSGLANSSLLDLNSTSSSSSSSSSSSHVSNTTLLNSQRISFSASTINTAGTADGYNPENIVCPGSGDSNWVMNSGPTGSWSAQWPFSFTPTKFRLYNLDEQENGIGLFRLLSFPSNGIMNLTYINETSNEAVYCDAWCQLPLSSDQKYVDFEFVNPISTSGLQVQILSTMGSRGGLSGIEVWQNDVFTYANETYNTQDSCVADNTGVSQSSLSGDFYRPDVSGSTYVSIDVTDPAQISDVSVRFEPNVTYSGNYSMLLYTPGCVQDGTCAGRSGVQVSVFSSSDSDPVNTTLYETNDYDKYDSIFMGHVEKPTGDFRPYVLVTPLASNPIPFTFVADRIQTIVNSIEEDETDSIQLNSIFEFQPSNFTDLTNDSVPVGNTTINSLGYYLSNSSSTLVSSLFVDGDYLVVGGNFTSSTLGNNLLVVDSDGAKSANGGGLNGPVNGFQSFSSDSVVVFGNFTGPVNTTVDGANNVVFYNFNGDSWNAIANGVDGEVAHANVFNLNGTSALGFTGSFTHVLTNNSEAISVDNGFGLYVPDQEAWVQMSNFSSIYLKARISKWASFNNTDFYAGYVSQYQSATSGASFVNDDLSVSRSPFEFAENVAGNSARLQSRNTILQNGDNVINAGVFANSSFSVMAGHFKANANNETYTNLVMVNDGHVQGLPQDSVSDNSTFYDLYVSNNVLYAGGDFTGNVSGAQIAGILFYDLANNDYLDIQPPGISGDQAVVTNIQVRPNTESLVVAGSFTRAGSLACTSLCVYDLSGHRWTSPTPGLSGVVSAMNFIGNDVLVIAGDLKLNDSTIYFAQYDFQSSTYSSFGSESTDLPGPINSFVLNGNGVDSVFASGLDSSSGDYYVSHWNGSGWNSIDEVIQSGSTVTELVLMQLQNSHTANPVLPSDEVLLVSGNIILRDFGNVSAVFFDGSSWQPAYLTTTRNGTSGSINSFFSQSSSSFSRVTSPTHMKRGFVVLVALAIAVALTFLCVGLGLLVAYFRRRNQGYVQAMSRVSEAEMAETVPPAILFEEMAAQNQGPRRRASGLL